MSIRIQILARRLAAVACSILLITGSTRSAGLGSARQQGNAPVEEPAKIPNDQLDSLVAPIALYPDPLLAQVMAASTYPLEIIQLQQWLAQHKDEIEIFYLPAYAPEHNPDEYLNNDLKQTIKNKPRARTRDDLVATTSSILKSIQRRPDRVKSYFHVKHVRYAA